MDILAFVPKVTEGDDFGEAIALAIQGLTKSFTEYARGGFTAQEVMQFLVECVGVLVMVGMQYPVVPIAQRERAIAAAIRVLYNSRNPNIPWVPEPMESMLEQTVLSTVVPHMVHMMFTVLMSR